MSFFSFHQRNSDISQLPSNPTVSNTGIINCRYWVYYLLYLWSLLPLSTVVTQLIYRSVLVFLFACRFPLYDIFLVIIVVYMLTSNLDCIQSKVCLQRLITPWFCSWHMKIQLIVVRKLCSGYCFIRTGKDWCWCNETRPFSPETITVCKSSVKQHKIYV